MTYGEDRDLGFWPNRALRDVIGVTSDGFGEIRQGWGA